jgi:hypothetical protein
VGATAVRLDNHWRCEASSNAAHGVCCCCRDASVALRLLPNTPCAAWMKPGTTMHRLSSHGHAPPNPTPIHRPHQTTAQSAPVELEGPQEVAGLLEGGADCVVTGGQRSSRGSTICQDGQANSSLNASRVPPPNSAFAPPGALWSLPPQVTPTCVDLVDEVLHAQDVLGAQRLQECVCVCAGQVLSALTNVACAEHRVCDRARCQIGGASPAVLLEWADHLH